MLPLPWATSFRPPGPPPGPRRSGADTRSSAPARRLRPPVGLLRPPLRKPPSHKLPLPPLASLPP
eukprot:2929663-Prorocentrum_lima.AAC.1